MSKQFQKILKMLKTSEDVKALGFDKEEIKRLASNLDKKLTLEEDASDEDVESAIEEAIDSAIPYLKLAQSTASRIVKKKLSQLKKEEEETEDEDEDDEPDDEVEDDEPTKPKKPKKPQTKPKEDNELKSMLKTILRKVEKQDETIESLRTGNTRDKWRKKLEKAVENTGRFGKSKLRDFDRFQFKSEDEFEEFLDEVAEDLEETNQERANAGLEKLGLTTAPQRQKNDQGEKVEVATDEEIDKLADDL